MRFGVGAWTDNNMHANVSLFCGCQNFSKKGCGGEDVDKVASLKTGLRGGRRRHEECDKAQVKVNESKRSQQCKVCI